MRTPFVHIRHSPKGRARALAHLRYTICFHLLGSFYEGNEWVSVEAQLIRDECEELGLPMGYGRVGKTPTQLDESYGETARWI